MVFDINQTLPFIDPLARTIGSLVDTVKVLVGGLFGVYLIMAFLQWKNYRLLTRTMMEVRNELHALNKELKINARKVPISSFERKLERVETKLGLK
jgi:hypothetical protein